MATVVAEVNGEVTTLRFGYDPSLVDIVRGIPGRRYNPDYKEL